MLSPQNYHDDTDLATGQNPGTLVHIKIAGMAGCSSLGLNEFPFQGDSDCWSAIILWPTKTQGLQTHGLSRARDFITRAPALLGPYDGRLSRNGKSKMYRMEKQRQELSGVLSLADKRCHEPLKLITPHAAPSRLVRFVSYTSYT